MPEKPLPTLDQIVKAQEARRKAAWEANLKVMSPQTKKVVQPSVPYGASNAAAVFKSEMR